MQEDMRVESEGQIEDKEIMRLKHKVNRLLDVNDELRREIESLKGRVTVQPVDEIDGYTQKLLVLLKELRSPSFYWLPYKNNTINARGFYRVEKKYLDRTLIRLFGEEFDKKIFIAFLANIGIFKSDEDGNILFSVCINQKNMRAYFIRKEAVDLPGC